MLFCRDSFVVPALRYRHTCCNWTLYGVFKEGGGQTVSAAGCLPEVGGTGSFLKRRQPKRPRRSLLQWMSWKIG
eukprot:1844375-Pleurochrysis_carterae.AAC.1